jgi:hypothetical protein
MNIGLDLSRLTDKQFFKVTKTVPKEEIEKMIMKCQEYGSDYHPWEVEELLQELLKC